MKKILIALTIVISCLGIRSVSAESLQLVDTTEQNFSQYKSILGNDNFNTIVNNILTVYENSYMSDYPYFYISVIFSGSYDSFTLNINLNCEKNIPEVYWTWAVSKAVVLTRFKDSDLSIKRSYNVMDNNNFIFDLNQYSQSIDDGSSSGWQVNPITIYSDDYTGPYENAGAYYSPFNYYLSNFDLYLPSLPSEYQSYSYIKNYDSLSIPKLNFVNTYDTVPFSSNFYKLEPYYLFDSDINIEVPNNITEINLNDYAYVILSLKNYEVEPFKTTIQVKGQFCPTPVYRLGTASSEEVFGTGVKDICTPYYDTYTPYSLSYYSDYLEKFAMLYVKAYDTTKDNYIKVDNRIFDITYVSEEEKDSPLVHYQGNTIQTIPYDKLPSTSTLNTQIGYVPDYGNSFSFDDIFTQPLKFLTSVWSTIVTFFSLITSFIALMPPELRGFLFASFTLGIALGLVKIIIG